MQSVNLFKYLRIKRRFWQPPLFFQISQPTSRNLIFFSYSPIKAITCRRQRHNMMIMIMTGKHTDVTRGEWGAGAKQGPRQQTHRGAADTTKKRCEIKADPLEPPAAVVHTQFWNGDTGVSTQYLLIALWLIYERSSGTWHRLFLFRKRLCSGFFLGFI